MKGIAEEKVIEGVSGAWQLPPNMCEPVITNKE